MKVRPFSEDDFPVVAAVLADDERFHGRPIQVGVNDLHEWTSTADLANDSWLYEDDDGPVAAGWCATQGDVGFAIGVVHPRAKGRGLGSELVERSESALRTREIARIHQFVIGADSAAAALLTARGYRDARHFYEMAIQLDDAPDVPDAAIEVFRENDARVFHDALDEAFQDHWEHHGQGFDEWWNRHRASPTFDPTLWFLIRDGDEVAAVCRNEANRNGGGYVAALGVRRPWRGKGYAKALLLYTFREFYERGMPRVTLGVDAESPTGATHLYERVGMHVEGENVVFEKAVP
jgi:GNAT superfamily N-acetyltransferase